MLWLDVLPVISAIVVIAGLGLKAGRILEKLDNVVKEANKIGADLKEVKAELKEHDKRLTVLEAKFSEITKKLAVT
ncbi:MAG: hypothetical protein O8C63_08560 [Candidatus Methanoperedens sp.]|nr:hypothetical protein [Candidatus Methanoperedens sp.]